MVSGVDFSNEHFACHWFCQNTEVHVLFDMVDTVSVLACVCRNKLMHQLLSSTVFVVMGENLFKKMSL
jgi:hypothetical protein